MGSRHGVAQEAAAVGCAGGLEERRRLAGHAGAGQSVEAGQEGYVGRVCGACSVHQGSAASSGMSARFMCNSVGTAVQFHVSVSDSVDCNSTACGSSGAGR